MLFETFIPTSSQNSQIDCKQLFFDLNGKEIKKISNFDDLKTMPHVVSKVSLSTSVKREEAVEEAAEEGEDEEEGDKFSNQNLNWSDSSDGEYERVSYSSEDGEQYSDDDYDFGSKNEDYYFSRGTNTVDNDEVEEEQEEEEEKDACPFWYTYEDPEQISGIFATYQQHLINPNERTRSSQLFVGKIKRLDATVGNVFQTFDTVIIHNEQISTEFPIVPEDHSVYIITTWDKEEGIPTSLFTITQEECLEFWRNRVQIKASTPSFLYCEPHYYAHEEYVYSSSSSERKNKFQFDYTNFTKKQIISW